MKALMFETEVLADGIIQIPELIDWKNSKIKIFIIKYNYKTDKIDFVEEPVTEYRKLLKNSNNEVELTIETAIEQYKTTLN